MLDSKIFAGKSELQIFIGKLELHIKQIAKGLINNCSWTQITIFKPINICCRDYLCLDLRIPNFFENPIVQTSIKVRFDKLR